MQMAASPAMSEERLTITPAIQTAAADEGVHAVAAENPVPAAAPEPAFVPEPEAASPAVHAEPSPAPVPVHFESTPPPGPAVSVEKALQESGLVMIQTDPHKVKLAEPVAETRVEMARPRPRRAPPPDTGPLQIVETKK